MTSSQVSPYVDSLMLNSELLALPYELGEFVIAYLPDLRDCERRLGAIAGPHRSSPLNSDSLVSASLDAAQQ